MKTLHLSGFPTFQVNYRNCFLPWNLGKDMGKDLKLKFCPAEGQNNNNHNNVSFPFLRYHFLPLKDPKESSTSVCLSAFKTDNEP